MRRNNITPRILAMILSAATLFNTVSTVAFANEDINTVQEVEESQEQEEIEQTEVVEPETQAQGEAEQTETAVEPETQAQEETEATNPAETEPTSESIPEPQPTETEPQPTQSEQEESPEVPATTQEETESSQVEESESETVSDPTEEPEATEETTETADEPTTQEKKEATEETTDSLIGELKSKGKEVAQTIISAAKGKVSELIGSLVGAIPGGEYIKSLFNFLTGALGDEIIGNIWGDVEEIDPVIEKLEQIQADISKISSSVIELKNTTFRNAINEVHRITGQYINDLITYNKAVSELKKEPEGSERIAALEENVNMAKATLVALASNQDISQSLRTNLSIAIQYMSSDTLGGEADNPFLLNLEAKKADPSLRYGADLLAQQKQFDETVWRFFAEGLTLYSACMQINASVTENDVNAQLIAQNLASLLTGSSDGSESYIGNSVLNAIKIYNTKIRSAEDEIIGEYKRKSDDVVKFKFLINTNISQGGVFTNTDGNYNTQAETYLMGFDSNDYETYLKKLNNLIKEEYLKQYSSITLRRFITEKLGVTVPAQSKYLLLSNLTGGFWEYTAYVKVIALDETNPSIEDWYVNKSAIDNVCFFTESINSIEDRAASITLYSNVTINFSTFEEAWNFINDANEVYSNIKIFKPGCTIKLYQDVIAQKNGDENFTRFGYGRNFTSKQDGKTVYGALVVHGYIKIDLNGHTINRNQDVAVAGGSVFMLINTESGAARSELLKLKNGTITGGNTTGNGGGIVTDRSGKVALDNMVLTGNHADGYGGALYYEGDEDYEIKDTTITNNTAGKNGGGIYCKCKWGVIIPDIVAKGTVVIWGNTVNGKANNATLTDSGAKKSIFKLHSSFSKNSKIGVNSTTTDKWLDITNGCDLSKECKDCFSADNENQSLQCYKSKFLRNWYIRIWNNNKK